MDTVWEWNTRAENQLSDMNCQAFSVGSSSGQLGGNGSGVMLDGTVRRWDMCQRARSMIRAACAASATAAYASSRRACAPTFVPRAAARSTAAAESPRSGMAMANLHRSPA